MVDKGLKCTIGSDDPVVFATSLKDEYQLIDPSIRESLLNNAEEFTAKYGYL